MIKSDLDVSFDLPVSSFHFLDTGGFEEPACEALPLRAPPFWTSNLPNLYNTP